MRCVRGMQMADVNGFLLLSLSSCFLVAQASEPNCLNVPDFGRCLGINSNFCPQNIECACKDKMPFCKCPNYRDSWSDYWYMGAKCDHLFNTVELISLIVFPAAALASMAGVMVQWVYYCKSRPRSHAKHDRAKKQEKIEVNIPTINPVYSPDLPSNVRRPQTKDDFTPSYLPIRRVGLPMADQERYTVPSSGALENNFSSPHHPTIFPHVSRKPDITYNTYSQIQPTAYDRSVLPDQDYDDDLAMDYPIVPASRNLRPIPEPSQLPNEDHELNTLPAYSLSQWSNTPFRMGRPQVKNQYGY